MTTTTEAPSRRAALGALASIPALWLSLPLRWPPARLRWQPQPALAASARPTASAPTQEAPNEGELVSLGQRIEKLARERVQPKPFMARLVRASKTRRPRSGRETRFLRGRVFSEIGTPSLMSSFGKGFKRDTPYDDGATLGLFLPTLRDQRRTDVRDDQGLCLERSGYASAKERVESIDGEIRDLASRALKIKAVTLAGAGAQAIALLSVRSTRPWLRDSCFDAGAMTLSRTVKALSEPASV